MQKPNVSLKFAAAAITASRKAQRASTKTVRAYFQKKAQQYLMKAATASDAGHAVRMITATNMAAVKASKAKVKADFEDTEFDDLDEVDMIDDSIDMDDDIVLAESEDEDSEEADDDEEDKDDAEDEVDARLASILARARSRRRTMARLQAKRQNRR
jgi:hypothetical protein